VIENLSCVPKITSKNLEKEKLPQIRRSDSASKANEKLVNRI
jgi:DNA-directed RNA polymerase subunit H (RpoH/RPB5)